MPLFEFVVELCNPEGSNCIQDVTVNITDDRILEESETFAIEMGSDFPRASINNSNTAIVTILDNDCEWKLCYFNPHPHRWTTRL